MAKLKVPLSDLPYPSSLWVAFINHVLRAESWARERLKRFSGKSLKLHIPPIHLHFIIDETGYLDSHPDQEWADAEVLTGWPAIGRWIVEKTPNTEFVRFAGDTELAREFTVVLQQVRWDMEEDLSHAVGDILAHRMVSSAKRIMQWHRESARNLAESFAEYWTEEQPLIAKTLSVGEFVQDVDVLRDDIERLEKKLERFARQISSD
jgi:ubiquinone biosynthesis protein UbiJ